MEVKFIDHITITQPDGVPRLKGHRITVEFIVEMVYRYGETVESLVEEYDLTPAEIHSALAFYHDNQELIDSFIRQADANYEQAIAEGRASDRDPLPDGEMTTAEVAERYGIAAATVRQTILRGALRARKSGGTWLIRPEDADAQWGDR
jgi:excisionase family DNA binding protein